MRRKNLLQCEAGSSIHRADDVGNPSRKTLSLQLKKTGPVVSVTKDRAFYRVVIDPPMAENDPARRPLTFGSLVSAEREAAIIAKIIGGVVTIKMGT